MGNPLVQPDLGLYIWTIVTFLLLLWAFNKLAWKPLKGILQAREDTIRKSLDDARQAREEMQRLKNESAQILAGARAEAATIVKNAEQRIEMETARALQQIRSEAVEFSVAIASKILQRNVSKEDNERLIEETFRQIQSTRPS